MSLFQGATNFEIKGGVFVAPAAGSNVTISQESQPRESSAFKDLSAAAAHTALHDSAARFDAPRCYRNTRAKYRNQFELWMLGKGDDFEDKQLIWLHGGAGAGKSAIMQSIVEQCTEHGTVLGSFFFSRGDSTRNHAEVLIPTLSYQVARAFPEAMVVLDPIIRRDPLIFNASLQTQAVELLIRPLLYLFENGIIDNTGLLRRTFVIDGLDECSDPRKQALIIQVITSILCDHSVPVSFLIASRLEVAISSAFEREKRLHGTFSTITLDDDVDVESDICQFIEDSFRDILDNHPWRTEIPLPWPNPTSIDHLVSKSSGHFIHAATAMKYIASSREHPGRALKVVEGLEASRTGSPFAELDALYIHILTSAEYSKQVLEILRHYYLSLFAKDSLSSVYWVHNMAPQDVSLFLSDVQSLVSLASNFMGQLYIQPKHASLDDFFKDEARSQGLYIAKQEYYSSVLPRYFQVLDRGPHKLAESDFHVTLDDVYGFISVMSSTLKFSEDNDLVQSLVSCHSPYDIWNSVLESSPLEATSAIRTWVFATKSICRYVGELRDLVALQDDVLYSHQLMIYIELTLDNINDLVHKKPQYHIIPALVFSSGHSGLLLAEDLIYWDKQFHIGRFKPTYIFDPLHIFDGVSYKIDPRALEAIRLMPQSQISWSADLAVAMKLVLHQLIHLSEPGPSILHLSPHRKWLRQHKGLKQRSLGSPRMSSAIAKSHELLYVETNPYLIRTRYSFLYSCWHRVQDLRSETIMVRRQKYQALLKAVIYYLPKSDCTNEVVVLARRSLPMVALWYPKLMKRARAEMDAYVRRWEDSPEGLLEMTKVLHVNNMD